MRQLSTDVWDRLKSVPTAGEQLAVRPAAPELTPRLLAALDANGERHLLVPLLVEELDYTDAQTRGVAVTTRVLTGAGTEPSRHLDMYCRDAGGHSAFDMVGAEVAARLGTGAASAPDIVRGVLAKWKRFWGRGYVPLSREAQLGLFGELWFLLLWMFPAAGTASVRRWRGPLGSRHDFEWEGASVECKCSTAARGRLHRVNGIDQLVPPQAGRLLFFSLRVREEGGATNSLPSLVERVRNDVKADVEAGDLLDALLGEAGYSSIHDEEYGKLRLRVVEEILMEVTGDFPRLTPDVFGGGLPPGVERVDYDVNLNTFDHLVVARSPADASSQLT